MVDITEVNDNGSFFELVSACEQGNLNEVQRLVEQQRWDPYEYEEAFIGAVANGSLDVVRYLCEKCGCDPFDSEGYALRLAFVKGDLEIVKYFLAKNMVRDQKLIVDIVTYLVKFGKLEVLKYFMEEIKKQNLSFNIHANDEKMLRMAAKYERLDVVKYLIKEWGCNYTVRRYKVIKSFIKKGQLEALKFFGEELKFNFSVLGRVSVPEDFFGSEEFPYLLSLGTHLYFRSLSLETIIEAVRRPMGEEKQLWLLRFLLQYVNGKRNKKVSSVLGADLTVLSRRILSKVASEINI